MSGYKGPKNSAQYRRKKARFILTCILTLVLIASAVATRMGVRVVRVSGDSMFPTYKNGELVVMLPANYIDDNYPVCWIKVGEHNLIKRLIGYPGDTVELIDGDTYVNGELIMKRVGQNWDNIKFVLGEDQYVFLGDNRGDSQDSRAWVSPYVQRSQIMGIAINSGLK